MNINKQYNLKLNLQEDRDKFFIRTSKISLKQLEEIKNNYKILYSLTYLFEIVDGDKVAVSYIKNKIAKKFRIVTNMQKKQGAWSLRTYNKVLIRYFRLFGFQYGRKTETVQEPLIIKNNNKNIRKAFARGVLTFDGSIKFTGDFYMGLKSRNLIKDLNNIVKYLGIKNRIVEKSNINTIYINKEDKNALELLIKDTKKWCRLKNYLYGFKKRIKDVEEAKGILYEIYDKDNRNSTKFNEIIDYLIENKTFRSTDISKFFKRDSGIYARLRLLEKMKIISSNQTIKRDDKGRFNKNYNIYKINKNINQWRLP